MGFRLLPYGQLFLLLRMIEPFREFVPICSLRQMQFNRSFLISLKIGLGQTYSHQS